MTDATPHDDATRDPTPTTPSDTEIERFDHVLVGTGQATGTLLAGLPDDATIAVIEGHHVGGTCVNDGCTPTKTLIASAKVARQARRGAEYGVQVGDVSVDFGAVMERVNRIRHGGRDGLTKMLESDPRITFIRGWAAFEAPRTLRVAGRLVAGEHVHLNVGARARVPDLPGLDRVPWLDNARLLQLDEAPEHLVIVGGSYIGLEMAQAFHRLGSRVTVLEGGPQLMGREDADVADAARELLEDEGIDIVLNAKLEAVTEAADGIEVRADGRVVRGSHLLLAVGRVPNSDRLNLAAAGVETDERGYVQVDDRCRTTADGVWALGDVNGRGAFTHTSVNDAEIVLDALQGGPRHLGERDTVYAMFIDPPLGRVGMTEKEALAKGHRIRVATRAMKRIARAKEFGETEGLIKLIVDADRDRFLGVAALGLYGDEIANLFAVAMHGGVDVSTFRRTVLIHPTVGELLPWILDDLGPVQEGAAA
ncbi:MAG: mercuric reductase [Trueperaceae bacterium]|nr:mercuric reductase [Trueperaceae bacterium]